MQNCIVYNKGNKFGIKNEILLENIGRESETYLRYIIENYYDLPDVVVFTQGKISHHKGSDNVNFLINIKNEALSNSKSQNYYKHYDENKDCNWDKEWNLRKDGFFLKNNYKNNTPITFIEWFYTFAHLKRRLFKYVNYK